MFSPKKIIILLVIAFTLITGGVVFAKGGDAKQNILNPATCNINVANVSAGYNKSGNRITFFAGATQDVSGQTWHVTAVDAGVTVVNQNFPFPSTDWSIISNYTSPKGERTVIVTIATSDNTVICTQTFNYKV